VRKSAPVNQYIPSQSIPRSLKTDYTQQAPANLMPSFNSFVPAKKMRTEKAPILRDFSLPLSAPSMHQLPGIASLGSFYDASHATASLPDPLFRQLEQLKQLQQRLLEVKSSHQKQLQLQQQQHFHRQQLLAARQQLLPPQPSALFSLPTQQFQQDSHLQRLKEYQQHELQQQRRQQPHLSGIVKKQMLTPPQCTRVLAPEHLTAPLSTPSTSIPAPVTAPVFDQSSSPPVDSSNASTSVDPMAALGLLAFAAQQGSGSEAEPVATTSTIKSDAASAPAAERPQLQVQQQRPIAAGAFPQAGYPVSPAAVSCA
jgi:hypothetical protein